MKLPRIPVARDRGGSGSSSGPPSISSSDRSGRGFRGSGSAHPLYRTSNAHEFRSMRMRALFVPSKANSRGGGFSSSFVGMYRDTSLNSFQAIKERQAKGVVYRQKKTEEKLKKLEKENTEKEEKRLRRLRIRELRREIKRVKDAAATNIQGVYRARNARKRVRMKRQERLVWVVLLLSIYLSIYLSS